MNRNLIVWIGLMFLTVSSFYLTDTSGVVWALAAIMAATAFKGHLIVTEFMELRGFSHPLRLAMTIYCPLLGLILFFVLSFPRF